MSNVFGQPTTETLFTNPFGAPADLTAMTTLGGSAVMTGGRAVLTPSQTGINGSLTINDPAFHAGLNNAMTVSFKMTADQPINVFGTGGADGISYSFGNDVTAAGTPNGTGSKLRLSFDAADNSPNVTGIYLGYNVTGTLSPAGAGTLVYVGNSALWKIKQDVLKMIGDQLRDSDNPDQFLQDFFNDIIKDYDKLCAELEHEKVFEQVRVLGIRITRSSVLNFLVALVSAIFTVYQLLFPSGG